MTTPVIPTYTEPQGNEVNVGSSFLAAVDGEPYLLTSAHLSTMSHPTPRWEDWPRRIILRHPGGQVTVDLFLGADGSRVPVFGYAKYPAPSEGMADVIWLKLAGPFAEALPVLTYSYVVHSVDPCVEVDGILTAYGYPASAVPWPRIPADTCAGAAAERTGLMLLANLRSEVGYSGGPVLTESGALAGMLIGSNDAGAAQIVPADTLHSSITGRLRGSA